jgi:hypothetical protein
MKELLLIVTRPGDEIAHRVIDRLRGRVGSVRIDPAEIAERGTLHVGNTSDNWERELFLDGERIDVDRVRAIWWRKPTRLSQATASNDIERYVAIQWRELLCDLLLSVDCPWFPASPHVLEACELKMRTLMCARTLGFAIPDTRVTSDPDDAVGFFNKHSGAIISKVPGLAFQETLGRKLARYTEPVTRRDMRHIDRLGRCPIILQESIDKAVELRVTVVGERVFAAEIHSQASNHARTDWRKYDHANVSHGVHELPEALQRNCVALVRKLGLRYGAIDLILTPDGRYVFLEVNPNGEYGWIEDATSLPISAAIADHLAEVLRA